MKKISLFSVVFAMVLAACTGCTPSQYWGHWGTNGSVTETLVHKNKLFLGGDFTGVMAFTGGGAMVDHKTGMLFGKKKTPYVHGRVEAVAPDGHGGWYIGGRFTKVNDQARNYIAQINADGTLSDWNPDANDYVLAILVSGGRVYAGGNFTSIGGETRNHLAALDPETGLAILTWDPNVNGPVHVITPSDVDSSIYIGGDFSSIGGNGRANVERIDYTLGAVVGFAPGPNGPVHAIAVAGDRVYLGGDFSTVYGEPRDNIAEIDNDQWSPDYGEPTSWAPDADNVVHTLAISGTKVYAGGLFLNIGGEARNRIAALDADPLSPGYGDATGWNPGSNGYVYAIELSGDTLYAGGNFTTIGGETRHRVAALDVSTGLATGWESNSDDAVFSLAATAKAVYMGGDFTSCCARERRYLAAVDLATGLLAVWNPKADAPVKAFAASGGNVYVGGWFTDIGGATRHYLAELSATTGLATGWDPDPTSHVVTLALSGRTLYVGGSFTSIGGAARNRIAALNSKNGLATDWNPDAGDVVVALAVSDSGSIYAGGDFTSIGGESRNHLAELDSATGLATAWDPNPNAYILAIALSGTRIFVGGDFTEIGGETRHYIEELDPVTGNITGWSPEANGRVWDLRVSGTTVYAGGQFTYIGGQTRNHIAAIDADQASPDIGKATAWDPNADNSVFTIAVTDDYLYAGGMFSAVGTDSYAAGNLAGLDILTGLPYGM
ncbi:MAG: delta-60 repeat domain-containing protein [Spirochaetes bacterium]|nr:delta-60 repeat domain-containing protein [Spirochaetota bacterium]